LNCHSIHRLFFGAVRLLSGEIVPAEYSTWNGGSLVNDNWSTVENWVGGLPPLNIPATHGVARVLFDGTNRPAPVIDVNWDVVGVTFASTAGAFTNSGSQLTIRDAGILNNSSASAGRNVTSNPP